MKRKKHLTAILAAAVLLAALSGVLALFARNIILVSQCVSPEAVPVPAGKMEHAGLPVPEDAPLEDPCAFSGNDADSAAPSAVSAAQHLISPLSFCADNGETFSLRLESGEKYNCGFTVWAGPFGFCFSGKDGKSVTENDVELFLSCGEKPSASFFHQYHFFDPETDLNINIRLQEETYLLGWIEFGEDSMFSSEFTFELNDYQNNPWNRIQLVSPLATAGGAPGFTGNGGGTWDSVENIAAQTGGYLSGYDASSRTVTFGNVTFQARYDSHGFQNYSEEPDGSITECIITDDTVLTVRDSSDSCDMLLTEQQFFRMLENGCFIYNEAVPDYPIPCFYGADAQGRALYIGEAAVWDDPC